jgi:hypothetical protein
MVLQWRQLRLIRWRHTLQQLRHGESAASRHPEIVASSLRRDGVACYVSRHIFALSVVMCANCMSGNGSALEAVEADQVATYATAAAAW